ncbi:hypothetical protein [Pararhizobium arenae]|uniref:hypothetical protein n=1 Tax=Pararhizobium arenae TaxID=1856850 RepID=UPI00094B5239|nr:hypothetical protein [Pararhizobium arenae]
MTPFYILEAIYVVIAFACGYYTFAEGENNRALWNRPRLMGLLACVFWPVLMLVVLSQARQSGAKTRRGNT